MGNNKNFELYPEANLEFTFDGKRNVLIKGNVISVDARLGFEANYKKMIFFFIIMLPNGSEVNKFLYCFITKQINNYGWEQNI